MNSSTFSVLFVSFLLATLLIKLWLNTRHIRHILRHRGQVPAAFAEKISLQAHQKAADYTITNTKFGLLLMFINATVLICLTLLGGLQWIADTILHYSGPGVVYQIGLIMAYSLLSGLIDLPLDYYHKFVIEEKFGFNKMKVSLWLSDVAKETAISIVVSLPLIWVVLALMEKTGQYWWLYTWLFICAYLLLMQVVYPAVFMPMFNKFTPLPDGPLKQKIEGLMQRTGFSSNGLFVMDGSKRSTHSNANFSGFGAKKRVVFFDTLIERLSPDEIEAVLAHELGHFKLKHIIKNIIGMFGFMLVFLLVLGFLKDQAWFYTGLGVNPLLLPHQNDAMALLLFMLVLPSFTFVLSPLTSILSRKHEYEADAFAAQHAKGSALISSLVKMFEDNGSTVTPDPLRSTFYDSHPPAALRIGRLHSLG